MKLAIPTLASLFNPAATRVSRQSSHVLESNRSKRVKLVRRTFFWSNMLAVAVYLESVAMAFVLHRGIPAPVASIPVGVIVAFGIQLAIDMMLSARESNAETGILKRY
ncbi:hypothetical protein [Paraburkholderia sp. SIMBA_054]|uniref:hypothetical protein n=1 Tax=Paraburkholderia sp. SIMBA_054 TaxID=3085795 RepID=UPI00397AF598